jgi:flagellar motility protein MotE (MotC chaperone)
MSAGDAAVRGAAAGTSGWLFRRGSLPLLTAIAAALALGLHLAGWLQGPRPPRAADDEGAVIGLTQAVAGTPLGDRPSSTASGPTRTMLAPPSPLRPVAAAGERLDARRMAGAPARSSVPAGAPGPAPDIDLPGGAAPEPAAGPDDAARAGAAAEAPGAAPADPPPTPTATVSPPAGAPAAPAPIACPTSVEGLEDVAADLVARRARFDEREMALLLRAAALEETERRLAQRAAELEQLAADLQSRSGELDAAQAARIARLVKVYEAMKPKQAAEVFDRLPLDLAVGVAAAMREVKIAAVLAAMSPDRAQRLTTELARLRRPAAEPGASGSP